MAQSLQVEPVTLVGNVLRLEPLRIEHAADLFAVAEPDLFKYHFSTPEWSLEGFRAYVDWLYSLPAYLPFAQVLQESGKPVGVSCYMDIRPAHRGLEIGSTWLARPYQGTKVNPESKYLLLRHAFEELGAVRVQLKTDGRNKQSQAAIAKMGAKLEGTLRRHMVLSDGFIRDTVMFSVTDEEWPSVKSGLEARLGYVPGAGAAE